MEQKKPGERYNEIVAKLEKKYEVMGQDLSSYLDGLLYSDYLTYWDYIHLDTLLSLQNPKTSFPDEKVFIVYHQISELYFKLIIWEIEQITAEEKPNADFFQDRLKRIIRYFEQLVSSFAIMVDGLDKDQFLKFRMALLPSSGFQSAQYRYIELMSTDLINLVSAEDRATKNEGGAVGLMEKLYWRKGATELASGVKTLTLKHFEEKYMRSFSEKAVRFQSRNLNKIYTQNFKDHPQITELLRAFDRLANVVWPLSHLKSAGKYLRKDPDDIRATGGTNWQKYLPPRLQRIFFFPELWSDAEKAEWGTSDRG